MNWILIGTVLGSIVTSQHETQENCEGRKAMLLKENKIYTECFKNPIGATLTYGTYGTGTTIAPFYGK